MQLALCNTLGLMALLFLNELMHFCRSWLHIRLEWPAPKWARRDAVEGDNKTIYYLLHEIKN